MLKGKALSEVSRARGRPRHQPGQPTHRRTCEQISYPEAIDFVRALHFAREIDLEPNLHVTVQWKHADSPYPVAERLRRLLNNIGVWLRRSAGVPSVWAYSREVGKLKGEHLHLMVYVPQARWSEFRRKLNDWLALEAMAAHGEVRPSAIRADGITPGDVQRSLKSYFLKDGTTEVRDLWVKAHHKATGGKVEGKRIKVSHAIGPTARRKASEMAPEADVDVSATYTAQNHERASTGRQSGAVGLSKVEPDR